MSRNLVAHSRSAPLNADLLGAGAARFPWLIVRDGSGLVISDRVAAVIIAAGPPAGRQARSTATAPAAEYLDSLNLNGKRYHNWDSDGCQDDNPFCIVADGEDFLQAEPSPQFNDRLTYITIDELLVLVQTRITKEVANCLRTYAESADSKYPWAAPMLADVEAVAYRGAVHTRFGRVPSPPLKVIDPLTGLPDPAMPEVWPTGCFSVAWPYWMDWRALVFYAIDDGYRPGGNAGSPALNLDGDAVPAVVIGAGSALTALGQQRLSAADAANISNYLEDDNRDFPGVPGAETPAGESFVSERSGLFNDLLCAPTFSCSLRTRAHVGP